MRFACDNCGAQYMIADEKIGAKGVKVRCKKCSHMIVVRPPQAEEVSTTSAPATEFGTDPDTPPAGEEQSPAGGQMGGAFDAMFGQDQAGLASSPIADETKTYETTFGASGQSVADQAFAESGGNGAHGSGYGADFGGAEQASVDGSAAPGAASFESGDGTAGDDPFGFGSTPSGGDTDFALGALEREPTGAGFDAEPSRPAGEKEWYVAIDDSQVGPIDLSEVEQRWDGRELDEDSLAWKAGMADWMPIADVPELAYLITERPQSQPSAGASFGNTAATLGGSGTAAAMSVGSASFDSSQGPAIDWKPSAASALSSLVEEEIVAPSASPTVEAAATPQPALEGMPSFGASDVFGSASGNGAEAAAPSLGAPGPVAPMGDLGGGWSVPEARPASKGGSGVVIALVALVLVLLVAVGGGAYYLMVFKPSQQPPENRSTGPVLAEKPKAEPETPAEPEPKAAEPEPEKPEVAMAETPSKPEEAAGAAEKPESSKPRTRSTDRKKPRTRTSKPSTGSVDDVFKKPKAAPASTANLDKGDIIDGVKKNGGKLKPCLTAARSKGEILPGKYRFILNWRIQPSGGVSNASLSGPSEVMKTSLPKCFGRVMSSWKFSPSKSGAPVKNFPLPINVR